MLPCFASRYMFTGDDTHAMLKKYSVKPSRSLGNPNKTRPGYVKEAKRWLDGGQILKSLNLRVAPFTQ